MNSEENINRFNQTANNKKKKGSFDFSSNQIERKTERIKSSN